MLFFALKFHDLMKQFLTHFMSLVSFYILWKHQKISRSLMFSEDIERDKYRSSRPELLSEKGVLKICRKFTREHPCQNTISVKLPEITLRHGFSPVNLVHISRTHFPQNTSGWLILQVAWNGLDIRKDWVTRTMVSKDFHKRTSSNLESSEVTLSTTFNHFEIIIASKG